MVFQPAPHYYNENDRKKAAWLRELIQRDLIAQGDVDERSITEVQPSDLAEYTQCHFFAGIGVWSYALRLAGWPDDRQVWTGSCPCQPFSSAGKGKGVSDARHLWPDWFRLIRECRPRTIFGEQVASPAGLAWLDAVSADLESADYAGAANDLCAAGVGAPHIRQRLYFVADAEKYGHERLSVQSDRDTTQRIEEVSVLSELAHPNDSRPQGRGRAELPECADQCTARSSSASDRLGNTNGSRKQSPIHGSELRWVAENRAQIDGPNPLNGPWSEADWLRCADHKLRPVEPSTFPLAHGAPARVVRLRSYGDAIVAQVAQTFIEAYLSL